VVNQGIKEPNSLAKGAWLLFDYYFFNQYTFYTKNKKTKQCIKKIKQSNVYYRDWYYIVMVSIVLQSLLSSKNYRQLKTTIVVFN